MHGIVAAAAQELIGFPVGIYDIPVFVGHPHHYRHIFGDDPEFHFVFEDLLLRFASADV